MQQQPTREEWIAIMKALAAPFPADDIELRYEKAGKISAGQSGAVLAYVTARAVQDRLDEVVPGAWQFTYDVLSTGARDIEVVKGRIEVYGLVREDVGDAPNLEKSKGAVSDAMKRAAVQWGIGRYLYKLPKASAKADGEGKIPASFFESWAKAYNRRFGLAGESAPAAVEEEAAPVAPVAAPTAPSSRPVAPSPTARTVDQLVAITSQAVPEENSAHATQEQLSRIAKACNLMGRQVPAINNAKHARLIIESLEKEYREIKAKEQAIEATAQKHSLKIGGAA